MGIKDRLAAIEDTWEQALETISWLKRGDIAITRELLGNPYVEDEVLYLLSDVPTDCPWQLGHTENVVDQIEQIWSPLLSLAPVFVEALRQSCQAIVARRRGTEWSLLYVIHWDDERNMAKQYPDSYNALPIWEGGPPNPTPELPPEVRAAGWSLPEPLRLFYGIHDGFGNGLYKGVDAIAPCHALELLREDWPERLEVYCDSGGHRRLYWRNPLAPEAPPITLDWDRYTHELAAPRSFYQFLDWEIGCELLHLDSYEPLAPVGPPPALDAIGELAIVWSDIPLLPIGEGAEIDYVYSKEFGIMHPKTTDVAMLAAQWRDAFQAAGWSIEGEASLAPTHAALRYRRTHRVLDMLLEARERGVLLHIGRAPSNTPLDNRWSARPIPLEDAIVHSIFDDPVEHMSISYPLAALDEIQARWREAWQEWECIAEREGMLRYQRDEEQIQIHIRQAALGVEVMVFDTWGQPLPTAFSHLQDVMTGPVASIEEEFGSEILNVIWLLSGHSIDYNATYAALTIQRWSRALEAHDWHLLHHYKISIGPLLWFRCGRLWASLTFYYEHDYSAMIYLRHIESQPVEEPWQQALEADGCWMDGSEALRWVVPWPAQHGQQSPEEDALAWCEGRWQEVMLAHGWECVWEQHTFTATREGRTLQGQCLSQEDGNWLEITVL